jgi:hypothetical protein
VLEKDPARRRAGTVTAVLAVLAVGILAYGVGWIGRDAAPPAVTTGPAGEPAASETVSAEANVPERVGDGEESRLPVVTAVFEAPLDPPDRAASPSESPPSAAIPQPVEDPRQDAVEKLGDRRDAAGCLSFSARPTSVEATRGVGPAVEVTVRVSNSCPLAFETSQTGFRVSASSTDGFELGSAVGRFPGRLAPYGSAEIAVNVPCDATRAARYRVEPH